MNTTIYVRGIHEHEAKKLSDSIRNYINEMDMGRIENLLRKAHEPIFLDITVTVAKPHPHHECDLRIHGPQFEIIVKKEGPELYKVIDEVFDETIQRIIKHKEKQDEHNKKADYYR